MLGAIIGDIVGSRFEFNSTNDYNFELFTNECSFTDDTICTIAVADALLKSCDYGESIHEWCRRYPHPMGGYGTSFRKWVESDHQQPYNSFGNGSAMRVSPIARWFTNTDKMLAEAEKSAACSHNHPEGIKGAQSVCLAIHDCLAGRGINRAIHQFHYNTNFSLQDVQNHFDETCQGTVPVAYWIIRQSHSFEDAIRKAVSLGADADTLGAIVGGIAECIWHIPEWLKIKALSYLPKEMREVLTKFRLACPSKKDHLLSVCHIYNGYELSDDIKQGVENAGMFWNYERVWVQDELKSDKNHKDFIRYFQTHVQKGQPINEDVPIGLQAIFASRIEHWGCGPATLHGVNNFISDYNSVVEKIRQFKNEQLCKMVKYFAYTRYYRGEEECPEEIKKLQNGEYYWGVERDWIYDRLHHKTNTSSMHEYLAYVKPDVPAEYGIPLDLLAEIFIRTGKWCYSMADHGARFKELIENDYMSHFAPLKFAVK